MSDQPQPSSSLDELLARSWASRAQLSRNASVESKAEESLHRSTEASREGSTTQQQQQQQQSPPPPQQPYHHHQPPPPSSPPPAVSSGRSLAPSNHNITSGPEHQVGVTAATGEAMQGRDRSSIGGLDFNVAAANNNNNYMTNSGGGGASTDLVSPPRANSPPQPRLNVSNIGESSPTLVTTVETPASPSSDNNNQRNQNAASSSVTSPSSMRAQLDQIKAMEANTPSRSVPMTTALVDMCLAPVIPTTRSYREFFREAREDGGNHLTMHMSSAYPSPSSASSVGNNFSRSTPQQQGSSQPIYHSQERYMQHQNQYSNNNNNNNSNRTMETIVDGELIFLHQAYGDPTMSVVTHWTLLHQNLALELLARHWMMLLDASRLGVRHDRALAQAAMQQLRSTQEQLTVTRRELQEERSRAALAAGAPTGNKSVGAGGGGSSTTPLARSAATTPLRGEMQRHGTPPRISAVTLAPNIATSASSTAAASPSSSLPHPSQHVPLVWNSSVIQGVATTTTNNNNSAARGTSPSSRGQSPGIANKKPRPEPRDFVF